MARAVHTGAEKATQRLLNPFAGLSGRPAALPEDLPPNAQTFAGTPP